MRVDDMRLQFDFYYWATGKILEQAEQLSPEQFSSAPPIGDRSVRDLLTHLLDVEVSWREGWRAKTHRGDVPYIEAAEFASASELSERWRVEELLLRESLDGLTDADLDQPFIDGAEFDANWKVMQHLLYEGMQHRSEAGLLLTGYGHSPGDLTFGGFVLHPSGS
jgi:uncharacterized damage-inducible protein DinB